MSAIGLGHNLHYFGEYFHHFLGIITDFFKHNKTMSVGIMTRRLLKPPPYIQPTFQKQLLYQMSRFQPIFFQMVTNLVIFSTLIFKIFTKSLVHLTYIPLTSLIRNVNILALSVFPSFCTLITLIVRIFNTQPLTHPYTQKLYHK